MSIENMNMFDVFSSKHEEEYNTENEVNENNTVVTPLQKIISSQNTEDEYAVPMMDFSDLQKTKLEEFDKKSWQEGKGYEAPSFPVWSEKMEGLSNGFYIFAGLSNSGKSAFTMNLAYEYAKNPDNHLHFLYFTLDDTSQRIIPRFISMSKRIPISVAAKPQRYQDKIDNGEEGACVFADMLKKREEGLHELKEAANMLVIQDAGDIGCAERMLNFAKSYKAWLQIDDPLANIIVVIDSLMDINIETAHDKDEKDRNNRISRMIKDWADNKLKCPIFGTAHLKKNTVKKPSIADLKESGRYEYDATAVFMVINDVSRNGQNASIFYNKPDDNEKHPVIEVQWAKNKASSFKERIYYYFEPNYSKVVECPVAQIEQFDQIIYSA